MKLLTDRRADSEAFKSDFLRGCRQLARAIGRRPDATPGEVAAGVVEGARRAIAERRHVVGVHNRGDTWWLIEANLAMVWLGIIVGRRLDLGPEGSLADPEHLSPRDAQMFVSTAHRVAVELAGPGDFGATDDGS